MRLRARAAKLTLDKKPPILLKRAFTHCNAVNLMYICKGQDFTASQATKHHCQENQSLAGLAMPNSKMQKWTKERSYKGQNSTAYQATKNTTVKKTNHWQGLECLTAKIDKKRSYKGLPTFRNVCIAKPPHKNAQTNTILCMYPWSPKLQH
jgi:hypothetical protein